MSSAQENVFSTLELLSLILSKLPHSSLLQCQLVSKTWASTFTTPELQQALFLKPANSSTAHSHSDLLIENFPLFYTALNKHFRDKTIRSIRGGQFDESIYKKNSAFLAADASWREMLVCQPAVYSLEFLNIDSGMGGKHHTRKQLSCPNGVRMGTIYDVIESQCSKGFKILWDRTLGDHAMGPSNDTSDEEEESMNVPEKQPCVTIVRYTVSSCCPDWGTDAEEKQKREDWKKRCERVRSKGFREVTFEPIGDKLVPHNGLKRSAREIKARFEKAYGR